MILKNDYSVNPSHVDYHSRHDHPAEQGAAPHNLQINFPDSQLVIGYQNKDQRDQDFFALDATLGIQATIFPSPPERKK